MLGLVLLGDRARIWPGCELTGRLHAVRLLAESTLAITLLIALIAASNLPLANNSIGPRPPNAAPLPR
jgi:hypothetical protein